MPNEFVSSSHASSTMPSLWSDLPPDLLESIKNKLERTDLFSLRLVCSQWLSAIPAPKDPRYGIDFDNRDNLIRFYEYISSYPNRAIYPRFSTSSRLKFIYPSNGWLVFITCNNKALHLFNPVSGQKAIFPPLFPNIFGQYNKLKPTADKPAHVFLSKMVVSSSVNAGVAVAGIIELINDTNHTHDRRLVFCRHGDGQEWSLLMEASKGISDIVLAGNNCFYAIGENWELYMLEERPPVIKLKKLRLWFPKQILQATDPQNDPTDEGASTVSCRMEASGESELKIYGNHWARSFGGRLICLKLDVTKLRCGSNDVDIACEAQWTSGDSFPNYIKNFFTPSLQKLSPNAKAKNTLTGIEQQN